MDAEIKASAPGLGGRNWLRLGSMREAGLIAIMLALCIAMTFASPHFLTWGNFRAMLMSFSIEGIVVVGMTILLIVGGIDLSVGSVVCFSMVVSGALFLMGLDPWTASLIGISASALVGAAMGFFVTVIGLNHFITSLAAMVIVRGLCLVITKGTPLSLFTLPPGFKAIGQGSFGNVPYVIVIFVVVVAIFDFLLRRATAFRKVFYTGSNEKAAQFSGIKTKQVKFWVTVLCSTLAGFAGVIYMSRFGAATPTFGAGMELNIIAAAVIGGASLNGGSGTIFGAILGMALLSVVTSSLILLDVSVYWQDMIKGCILLAAVSIDHFLHSRKS
ncbi:MULTISPECIES: ABC transporter permease [unclassified Mesorhizobium]|uniref:ABC transporter permease n=1 Tax=unclassified Mesorhizobium TaxID=325217 RepID=UPI000F75107E|nr:MULTISPECIES: ABC transporter permease [unclassified Mesorhizobium]AZO63821.1 ABC transporter permease [Mesorhizobium sp. M6A.T.Cr.TU.016.01.1.1]RVB80503.1 ABC transporter permease [Mesorhizobium sp. M6A.T.Cr.TU.014.01.1.1]RWP54940.1 MAG: ABC transporter permease [Mesorhizobium sp.]RWQ10606.1 MAG: ABC transporter permease [Mesorhizobium sp.]RWQ10911.1 MAG: ABC transporter permease [Mesorhizobium sp.]